MNPDVYIGYQVVINLERASTYIAQASAPEDGWMGRPPGARPDLDRSRGDTVDGRVCDVSKSNWSGAATPSRPSILKEDRTKTTRTCKSYSGFRNYPPKPGRVGSEDQRAFSAAAEAEYEKAIGADK